jgi:hypothetical protein
MKQEYKLIQMSFDGKYVTDSEHESIEDAGNASADLGSKWFFYPFSFIVKGQTVVDTGEGLVNMATKEAYMPKMFKRKRLDSVVKAFKKANDFCTKNEITCDCYEFENILINQNL